MMTSIMTELELFLEEISERERNTNKKLKKKISFLRQYLGEDNFFGDNEETEEERCG